LKVWTEVPRFAMPTFVLALLSAASLLVVASPAQAAVPGTPAIAARATVVHLSPAELGRRRGLHIAAVAGAQHGKPYRHNAQGPAAFDCSGLTGYAYRSVHMKLPRTAADQYRAARHIARTIARPGDLVFWMSGNHAYHVAIYAVGGKVWHAPKPGDRVRLARIWNAGSVRFGRIGA
jgi:cell wall-associated NlpC family hydrolase